VRGLLLVSSVVGIGGCTRHEMSSPKNVATNSARAPVSRPTSDRFAAVPAEDALTDSQISDAVLRQIRRDPGIDDRSIYVSTVDGIVQLSGTVNDLLSKDRIARVAETVRGVRAVSNLVRLNVQKRGDRMIGADATNALNLNAATASLGIRATSHDGTLTLTGDVGSSQEKQLAERIAKGVRGVSAVENQINVRYTALRSDPLRVPSAARPSDADIAQAIEDAAVYDPRVTASEIRPEVAGGVVTLRGVVDNLQAKLAAESLARHTVGALEVRNLIQVRSEKPTTDAERAERIRSALAIDPITDDDDISVDVKNGVASLHGAVDTYLESAEAIQLAAAVNGVASVGNHLKIQHPEAASGGSATMYDPYVESWTYIPRKVVRSDATIARDIRTELASTPFVDPKAVNVQVHGGTATLTGGVANWKQRTAATRDAFEGGAVAVDNKLQVK
jgi:osmotically-inducible protein OsmY